VRAGDLVRELPAVELSWPAIEAARLMTSQNAPGLIVVDDEGRPVAVLPGTEVLRLVVPVYAHESAAAVRAVDEGHADLFLAEIGARTVGDCLSGPRHGLAVVGAGATVLEVAAVMSRMSCPLVAVVDPPMGLLGVVTMDGLLKRMFTSWE
jgi:CBS domain-containing protein